MKLPMRGDFVKELRKEVDDLKNENNKKEEDLKQLKIRIERLEEQVEKLTKKDG